MSNVCTSFLMSNIICHPYHIVDESVYNLLKSQLIINIAGYLKQQAFSKRYSRWPPVRDSYANGRTLRSFPVAAFFSCAS